MSSQAFSNAVSVSRNLFRLLQRPGKATLLNSWQRLKQFDKVLFQFLDKRLEVGDLKQYSRKGYDPQGSQFTITNPVEPELTLSEGCSPG
jgi:hypothetical protein